MSRDFIPPKDKLLEFFLFPFGAIIAYLISSQLDVVILFSFGFIWNWSASIDLSSLMENKKYRFSLLKLVSQLQSYVLRPVKNSPLIIRKMALSLPAGLFWGIVALINQSDVPWWVAFIGSLFFEILDTVMGLIKRNKNISSSLPQEHL